MKRILLLIVFVAGLVSIASACDISVVPVDTKPGYKPGDVFVLEVRVKLTHRKCDVAIQKTKFTYENIKILGATDWREEEPGLYVRQIKVQFIGDRPGDGKLAVERKCEKDGGFGECTLRRA